jgi:predicted cupin superfamily sugar epimerase
MMDEAKTIIARLDLARHPEGGWYRETWRADAAEGARAGATAILFLLEAEQRSHWHSVDAAELWLWHAGSPILLRTARESGPIAEIRLGGDILADEMPQHLVHAHHWQAAVADRGWALVSCIVSPGFAFSGFTLAPEGWEPSG